MSLAADVLSSPVRPVLVGVTLGLVIGKPLGVLVASWLAVATGIARALEDVTVRDFVGAACLCGVGDTVALLKLLLVEMHHAGVEIVAHGILCEGVRHEIVGVGRR